MEKMLTEGCNTLADFDEAKIGYKPVARRQVPTLLERGALVLEGTSGTSKRTIRMVRFAEYGAEPVSRQKEPLVRERHRALHPAVAT
ncbi:hypothetical protein L0Y40_00580 [Candidatus Wolfebacteria bacterium]|nr:hypothetical protein [Candidatus Wolfebacteria bacterium]